MSYILESVFLKSFALQEGPNFADNKVRNLCKFFQKGISAKHLMTTTSLVSCLRILKNFCQWGRTICPLKIFPEEFNFFENFHGRISCEILKILNHVSEAATGGIL